MGTSVLFQSTNQGQVILHNRGRYFQTRTFHRKGYLHAKQGQGYVSLYGNHGTSAPDIRWVEIDDPEHEYETDSLGRMRVKGTNERL